MDVCDLDKALGAEVDNSSHILETIFLNKIWKSCFIARFTLEDLIFCSALCSHFYLVGLCAKFQDVLPWCFLNSPYWFCSVWDKRASAFERGCYASGMMDRGFEGFGTEHSAAAPCGLCGLRALPSAAAPLSGKGEASAVGREAAEPGSPLPGCSLECAAIGTDGWITAAYTKPRVPVSVKLHFQHFCMPEHPAGCLLPFCWHIPLLDAAVWEGWRSCSAKKSKRNHMQDVVRMGKPRGIWCRVQWAGKAGAAPRCLLYPSAQKPHLAAEKFLWLCFLRDRLHIVLFLLLLATS